MGELGWDVRQLSLQPRPLQRAGLVGFILLFHPMPLLAEHSQDVVRQHKHHPSAGLAMHPASLGKQPVLPNTAFSCWGREKAAMGMGGIRGTLFMLVNRQGLMILCYGDANAAETRQTWSLLQGRVCTTGLAGKGKSWPKIRSSGSRMGDSHRLTLDFKRVSTPKCAHTGGALKGLGAFQFSLL